MRQFSILVIFVVAFGGAAALYEHESRKVRGVLSQITELQAQLGDLQAEVNRLNGELETMKLAARRRPDLKTIARHIRRDNAAVKPVATRSRSEVSSRVEGRELMTSDVTAAPPAIHSRSEGAADDAEWNQPTVDAEQYRQATDSSQQPAVDPYQ